MLQTLKNTPLFADIEDNQLEALLKCLAAKKKAYGKEAFIFRAGQPATHVGIVLAGCANIIQEDFWGNRTILAHVEEGELFGEAFSCAETETLPVSVVAVQASEIMLIDYKRIITVCPAACVFHSRLIANMLRVLASKNILLTRKMEYVSQRTTREKLLAFLSAQALQTKSNEVTIPFNRQQLADYLCVERSALSRVLMEMKQEGILEYEKNRFRLARGEVHHA